MVCEAADDSLYERFLPLFESAGDARPDALRAIDLFAGIGGIRLGFEQAFGPRLRTVLSCEWDTAAQRTYKVRRFLRAVALGMEPDTPWQDSDEATGGYLIVTKEGELVAFYVYNRAKLDDYLFRATRFETPSTRRTDILNLRRVGDAWRFFLTLQIRFR